MTALPYGEGKRLIAPLVDMAPDEIEGFVVIAIGPDQKLVFNGSQNILSGKLPAFLDWAARNMRQFLTEVN